MRIFKDNDGTEWTINIVNSIKRKIKDQTGFDLFDFDQYGKLEDFDFLIDVLWIICKDQAESRSITEDQFRDSITGDVFDVCYVALAKAIEDFFPQSRRSLISEIINQMTRSNDRYKKAAQTLKETMDQKEQLQDKAMQKMKSKGLELIENELERNIEKISIT